MTRRVVVAFAGAATRQIAGTNASSEELGFDADSDGHVFATPTPHGNGNRPCRSGSLSPRVQNVPAFASNDADLGRNSLNQFQLENFSSGDFSTTPGRIITKSGRDWSA